MKRFDHRVYRLLEGGCPSDAEGVEAGGGQLTVVRARHPPHRWPCVCHQVASRQPKHRRHGDRHVVLGHLLSVGPVEDATHRRVLLKRTVSLWCVHEAVRPGEGCVRD